MDPQQDIVEYAQLMAELERRKKMNKLALYKPYPKQKEFHDAGRTNRERLLMASNQCLAPDTVIQTGIGERQIVEMLGVPGFDVQSWDGGEKCSAQSSPVYLKGIEPAFRVHLDNGEWFDCTHKHRVLTSAGWLSLDQLVSLSSGLHWTDKAQGSTASCAVGDRPDDLPPRRAQDTGPRPLPSPDDVREHSHQSSHGGVGAHRREYSRACLESARRSTFDDASAQISDLCGLFQSRNGQRSPERMTARLRDVARFLGGSNQTRSDWREFHDLVAAAVPRTATLVSYGAEAKPEQRASASQASWRFPYGATSGYSTQGSLLRDPHIQIVFPFTHTPLIGSQRLVAIEALGYKPILDLTVTGTNCYQATGIIHKNSGKTYCGGAEMAIHLTGRYPDWWNGRVFDKPIRAWAASKTGFVTRDGPQRMLVGEPKERDSWGSGLIPQECIERPILKHGIMDALDGLVVKHDSGDFSTLGFKSYDQGREPWQAETLDVIWLDEEPPMDVYMEGLTRTNATEGMTYLTFTPLLGVSEVVRMFLQDERQEAEAA
jgi:phage terminase large subunit-like protein